ncbi:MAG: glutathione synthase/RimK-type ligase-like ATP-grasp enzyme [Nonlabens sp.]|jgi:glutathione synthase/RimK-type ligase-like ATP-grasp enzyme|uniref:ATP-grasp domain-containing protein n=1 Tax=Nonlabens sp. TaxID=1888209 RepID=UPI0039E6FACD
MKVAIHHRKGSFSERWIDYCEENIISFIKVNAFDSNIVQKLQEQTVTHFIWHMNHSSSKDLLVFHYVMNSIEIIGIKCFPNFNTRWHFDDKIAQKYLLESIEAPIISSMVFYDQYEAKRHITDIKYPIVVKLKRGAGASNVKLLNEMSEAKQYIDIMFSTGLNPNPRNLGNLNQKIRLAKKNKNPFSLGRKVFKFLKKNRNELKVNNNEKGYFYYQEFIPNNQFDIRVIAIGSKVFGIKRLNRENDFRASGSGNIIYDHNQIDIRCVEIAFNTNKNLKLQCMAYDFVFNERNEPLIIEMCFGFAINAYDRCPGYWDSQLKWHEQKFNPQEWMLKELLANNI